MGKNELTSLLEKLTQLYLEFRELSRLQLGELWTQCLKTVIIEAIGLDLLTRRFVALGTGLFWLIR